MASNQTATASGNINVHFNRITGRKTNVVLTLPITREQLKKALVDTFGSDQYRLVIQGTELSLDNEEDFKKNAHLIQNGSMIYVLQRMKGGSKIVDIDTQRDIIFNALPDELDKVTTNRTLQDCAICMEEAVCYQACCLIMCKQCFIRTFFQCEYKFKCSVCNKLLNCEDFFATPEFITSLQQLDDTTLLARNIDFQICTCGSFTINDTMHSKQQCSDCGRWLCFFCNENWDSTKMTDQKYKCGNNCKWENYLTYQLVPSGYNKDLKIPNRRICPQCGVCGTNDVACKFHACPSCGHTFCFVCLKPEKGTENCSTAYDQPCTQIVKQDFKDFPHIGKK